MRAAKLKAEIGNAEIPAATNLHNDLLTQEELAARLKVGLRTLVRLQHDGAVPFIVLGKSVRFYWPAVVSHLNANSTVMRSLRSATRSPANLPSKKS